MKKIYFKLPLFALVAMTMVLGSCKKDSTDNGGGDPTPTEEKLASEEPGNSNAVLEEYTGVRCTYCPDGHKRAQALADANPGKVVLINVHTGSYATPAAGWPDFTTTFGNDLASMSNLAGYPAGSMNRFTFDGAANAAPYYKQRSTSMALSRGGFNAAGIDRMAQPTNVNMGMKSVYDANTRELKVTVELYYTGNETLPNYLNVVVLESGVVGKQIDAGVIKNQYVHNHMLRDMITGQWGEMVPTTTKGTRYKKTFTYTVSEDYVAENLDIAAYVTQEVSGKKLPIINGTHVSMIK